MAALGTANANDNRETPTIVEIVLEQEFEPAPPVGRSEARQIITDASDRDRNIHRATWRRANKSRHGFAASWYWLAPGRTFQYENAAVDGI
jgi:hypothetical protein